MKKKNFINYCGLLGVAALLSYTAAVGYSMFPPKSILELLRWKVIQ